MDKYDPTICSFVGDDICKLEKGLGCGWAINKDSCRYNGGSQEQAKLAKARRIREEVTKILEHAESIGMNIYHHRVKTKITKIIKKHL